MIVIISFDIKGWWFFFVGCNGVSIFNVCEDIGEFRFIFWIKSLFLWIDKIVSGYFVIVILVCIVV